MCSVAALMLAAVLAGCGGGHSGKRAASAAQRESSNATSPSAATTPAPAATTSATNALTPPTGSYWPYAKVVTSLAGRTVALTGTTVRLDPALLECNGKGAAKRAGPTRVWSRYTCTQTIFQGGTDHDITFDVVISSRAQLRIESPRNGSE